MNWLVAIMLALVPLEAHRYETEQQTRDRYTTIAKAIHDAGATDLERLYLITIARHESSFDRDVHRGIRRGDDGRSWCLMQILTGRHPGALVPGTKLRARDLVGLDADSTSRCIAVAAGIVRTAIEACGDRPTCVFSRYGGVRRRGDSRIKARVATLAKIRSTR